MFGRGKKEEEEEDSLELEACSVDYNTQTFLGAHPTMNTHVLSSTFFAV